MLAGRKDKHDKKTEKETPPYRTGHLFGPGPSVSDRRGQSGNKRLRLIFPPFQYSGNMVL